MYPTGASVAPAQQSELEWLRAKGDADHLALVGRLNGSTYAPYLRDPGLRARQLARLRVIEAAMEARAARASAAASAAAAASQPGPASSRPSEDADQISPTADPSPHTAPHAVQPGDMPLPHYQPAHVAWYCIWCPGLHVCGNLKAIHGIIEAEFVHSFGDRTSCRLGNLYCDAAALSDVQDAELILCRARGG